MVCPVLFELLRKWTTQRFTTMNKINIFSTKPGTQIRISQGCNGRVATFDISSTRDVTGNIAQFKMADVSNLEQLLRGEDGLTFCM